MSKTFFTRQALWSSALLLAILLLTMAVYWPGLNGVFLFDDMENLQALNNYGGVTNTEAARAFIFGNSSGSLHRPVAMASFLLNDQYWPGAVSSYHYTNLMIHLLCGLLVAWLILRLCQALGCRPGKGNAIALVTAAIWLLHPLNVSTTLYIIQRMTQLATLFTLAGLCTYTYARAVWERQPRLGIGLLLVSLGLFGLLGTFSKENGALILLLILVLEFTVFAHGNRPRSLKISLGLFVGVPLLIIAGYLIAKFPSFLSGYNSRAFTLSERLMTEGRLLIEYLSYILLPRTTGLSLLHDDIVISTGLTTPLSTLLSLGLIAVLLFAGLYVRKKQPVLSLSILWFFSAQILESSFIPLELYFEHRNYLPMIGPLFALVYYLFQAMERLYHRGINIRVLILIPLSIIFILAIQTFSLTTVWGSPGELFKKWAFEHPDSSRSQRYYALFLNETDQQEAARNILESMYDKNPSDVLTAIFLANLSCQKNEGKPFDIERVILNAKGIQPNAGMAISIKALRKRITSGICKNIRPRDLIHLMDAILGNTNTCLQQSACPIFYYEKAELYVYLRELDPAIKAYDAAFKIQPSVDIALREAVVLLSAGVYDAALEYLHKAMVADKARPPFTPSRMKELLRVKKAINTLQRQAAS